MKETKFIEQNKEKWQRFEKLSESQTKNPDELSSLYLDITDDLSYAQTFYKRRTVRVYLNQLAQRVYTGMHIQKSEAFKKIFHVWKVSLPIEVYRARKSLLLALIVFVLWSILGAVSTHYNSDFAKVVLGENYVSVTNENILKGKPLDIYQTESNVTMFIDITTNNLRVAFLCFIFGIFFTIGTHIFLFQNAVMLGTFQYFFATKGLLITSFLGIWIHGAFEISAIVLASGAGITLGNGLLFPKSYTRMQSLQLAAKSGIKIMLSLVPFIIIAGFLESYVTANYQNLAEWSKWLLIFLSFGVILFYYLVYPIIVARKHPELLRDNETISSFSDIKFDLSKIRSLGEIISDTFRFYRLKFVQFSKFNLLIWFPLALILVYFQDNLHYDELQTNYMYDWSKQLEFMMGFGFTNLQDTVVNFLWSFIIAGIFISIAFSFQFLEKDYAWKDYFLFLKKKILAVSFGNIILFYTFSFFAWYWYFLLLFIIPFYYLNGAVAGIINESFGKRFSLSWKYSYRSYGKSLLALFLFFIIMALFMQPIAFVGSIHDGNLLSKPPIPDLLDLACSFTRNIAQRFGWNAWFLSNLLRQLVYLLFLFLVFPLSIISIYFLAFNEHEKESANGLKNAFKNFGKRSRVRENDADYE